MERSVRFPIFPLSNVVLFPDARLPLHIFEPRYREMTADSLAADRTIGMVLLVDEESEADPPAIYEVGCMGVITEWNRLPDGRYHLILEGRRRFRILNEPESSKPYRSAVTELLDDPSFDDLSGPDREALHEGRDRLQDHMLALARANAPASVELLRQRMKLLDPVQLAHALAFGLDCTPIEKQALLQAASPLERCQRLVDLLAFRRAELGLPAAPRTLH
jgi:Lon protease-like protein